MTCHVDSPKVVVETAEKKGIKVCGYHASQAVLAPKGYLTGAEWDWEKVYTDYVSQLQAGKVPGKDFPNFIRGGIKEGVVRMSPYADQVGAGARKAADAAKAKFMDGSMVIFKGPLNDNEGKVILPAGKSMVQTAPELEGMNYLVEGVIGN